MNITTIITASLFLMSALFVSPSLSPAMAAGWQIDEAKSKVHFTYTRDGVSERGSFAKFKGSADFDADQPTAARLELSIATASIALADELAQGLATSAEWFDSRNHPDAAFQLTSLSQQDETRYAAEGVLTIRGELKKIMLPVDLEIKENHATASGRLTIVRKDYQLGFGPSAIFVEIGPEVFVDFTLVARKL